MVGFCISVAAADVFVVAFATDVSAVYAAVGALIVAVAASDALAAAADASAVDIDGGTSSIAAFVVISLAAVLLFSSTVANMSSYGVTLSILFFCCHVRCVHCRCCCLQYA